MGANVMCSQYVADGVRCDVVTVSARGEVNL